MTKNLKFIYFLLVLSVLSLNLASAQTLIAGKVYNSAFSDTISNVDIKVTCDDRASLSTISLSDGTYAVRFEESECSEGDNVRVLSSKTGYLDKTSYGTVTRCEGENCEEAFVIIVNLGIGTSSSSSGSSGHGHGTSVRFYMCGNRICDSGETVNTCPTDCKKTELLAQPAGTNNGGDNKETPKIDLTGSQDDDSDYFSGITGAVTGTLGNSGLGIVLIVVFLAGLIVLAVVLRVRKRKNFY